jgi:hypothetical protein
MPESLSIARVVREGTTGRVAPFRFELMAASRWLWAISHPRRPQRAGGLSLFHFAGGGKVKKSGTTPQHAH